jgi:hypothetical protein
MMAAKAKKGKKNASMSDSQKCTTLTREDCVTPATSTQVPTAVATIMGMTMVGMEDFYDLDPDGDVILTCSIPHENITDIPPPEIIADVLPLEDTNPPPNEPDVRAETEQEVLEEPSYLADPDILPLGDTTPLPSDEVEPEVGAKLEQAVPEEPSSLADLDVESPQSEDTFSVISNDPDCDSPVDEPLSRRTISFLVSSPHLRLVSPVFRVLLQQHAHGGGPQRTTIPIHNDDPRALLILLYIFHHRTRKVPDSISLDSLAKIATLVDKYNCAEAVEPFSRVWIDKLKCNRPDAFSGTLLQWLYIAWALKEPQEFKHAIRIAQRESCDNDIAEKAKELPIPDSVLGRSDLII